VILISSGAALAGSPNGSDTIGVTVVPGTHVVSTPVAETSPNLLRRRNRGINLGPYWQGPVHKTVHVPGTYPVQDIDGDGKLDVVTSIYNETGDGQWHVVARDVGFTVFAAMPRRTG
jgi:hypothetical protein